MRTCVFKVSWNIAATSRVLDKAKFLLFSNAKAKVIEFALPFAKTGFQKNSASSVQFTTIESKIAERGKNDIGKDAPARRRP